MVMTKARKMMIAIPAGMLLIIMILFWLVYSKARYATAETVLHSDCLLTHTDEAASLVNASKPATIMGGELTYKTFDGKTAKERHTWLYINRNIDRTNDAIEKTYKTYYTYTADKNILKTLNSLEIQEWHSSLLVSIPTNLLTYAGSLKRHENA